MKFADPGQPSAPVEGLTTELSKPQLRFYRLFESAKKPILADKSASGLLPTRAFRFCEAARIASSIGWYLFPSVSFSIRYDGASVFWRLDPDADWRLLDSVTLEGDRGWFDDAADTDVVGHCPPFISAAENGMLQIMTGLAVRTAPDWGILVRRPPNVPAKAHLEYFEGFVHTGAWFGPLFFNIKPLRTDIEIRFEEDWPLAFLQPFPVALADNRFYADAQFVSELDDLTDQDWRELRNTLVDRSGQEREVGRYAKKVRKN
ncbi:DUF6065 family protein [Pontivivens ytuae]|uniref:Uncharacterized protein n=1 Tax=Pontivivens ytuae TaxID=2789856 RepID=A0A7S9LSI8_9RHOB|nr:DUF6065 family protein [Pontivivens ytuae]QPH54504.1 hypothetical protein I0K15_01610 [Pontivivens ytuae]